MRPFSRTGNLKKIRRVINLNHPLCGWFRVADSNPDFFFPLSFAGGLLDRHTELVHFGFRDYDPIAGRFTTPDPAKDARGDGDLFDYCVDNPVGRRDPTGLLAPLPLAALGGMGSLGIAGLGTYGSASLVDWINKRQTGESSTAAVDAVNRVAPMVAGTVLGSHAASGAAGMAPSVVGSGLNVLTPAAVELGKYPAVINAIPDAISGFIVPGPPPPSLAGNVAGLASNTASELGIWDWIKNLFD